MRTAQVYCVGGGGLTAFVYCTDEGKGQRSRGAAGSVAEGGQLLLGDTLNHRGWHICSKAVGVQGAAGWRLGPQNAGYTVAVCSKPVVYAVLQGAACLFVCRMAGVWPHVTLTTLRCHPWRVVLRPMTLQLMNF